MIVFLEYFFYGQIKLAYILALCISGGLTFLLFIIKTTSVPLTLNVCPTPYRGLANR